MKFLFLFITILININVFSQEENSNDSTEIWTVVDPMPIFKEDCYNIKEEVKQSQCNLMSIQKFASQIEYPEAAKSIGIEGKVYISFVVDSIKNITSIQMIQSSGNEILDNAAIEHIKSMPSFYSPGYAFDKPCSVKYNIPIVFKLHNSKAKKKKRRKK